MFPLEQVLKKIFNTYWYVQTVSELWTSLRVPLPTSPGGCYVSVT